MKWTIALGALALAGCASQPDVPEATLRQRAEATRQYEEINRRATVAPPFVDPVRERHQQAAVICRERGNMAAAQPAYGGRGMSGSINAGLQQGWAASEVEAACWRAYQATGVMPSY